jgi:dTDP-4-dehydrorhamnose reductase
MDAYNPIKVAIIGAGSIIGESLYNLLINDTNYLPILFTNQLDFKKLYLENKLITCSPLEFKEFKKEILAHTPDIIVNAFGLSSEPERIKDKKQSWDMNATVAENIAKAAKIAGSMVILISSDHVFNGKNGPYLETDRPDPADYFGKAKLAAENITLSSVKNCAIIRISGLFGHSGFNITDSINSMLNKFENNETIEPGEDLFFNPIHAIDLAAIIMKIIRKRKSGLWHVGTREIISHAEFARIVAKVYDENYDKLIKPANILGKKPGKFGLVTLKTETDLSFTTPGILNSVIAHKSLSDGWKPIKLIY